jgi:hypothetical protein
MVIIASKMGTQNKCTCLDRLSRLAISRAILGLPWRVHLGNISTSS